ncbi:unnamed protein product [Closterium sp. NIES-54]
MRSLRTAQDSADTVRRCSRSLLLACHCCSRPPPTALPVLGAVRLCHNRVTCLPESLRAVRDNFLVLDPTDLTVDLLEQDLLAAETSILAVGAARGTPRTPFFEGCSPSPLAPSYASAAAAAVDVLGAEDVGAASTSGKRRSSKGKGGRGGGGGSGGGGGVTSGGGGAGGGGGCGGSGGGSGGSGSGGGGSGGSGGSGSGGSGGSRTRSSAWRFWRRPAAAEAASEQDPVAPAALRVIVLAWGVWGSGVAIFDLDYDAILSAMYALSASAEGIEAATPGQVAPPCSCHPLSHHTLLWHHHPGHPSLPSLREMHSRLLVSGLLRVSASPPALACPALPSLRRGAVAHRSSLLVSLDVCSLADSPHGLRLQLRERFRADLPVLRLHSDRGAAHQLNLWPRVSFPETSPTLLWTEKVADASVFRVWGSRAFVRDTSVDKLSARAIPCVFLGFTPNTHGSQFYHPTSRRVFPSKDVTFDESAPFYRLFPYCSATPPPLPLFLSPGPPPVDPLPPQGLAPLGVSKVDPLPGTAPIQVAVGSGAARGAASGGAASGGAEPGALESEGAGSGGGEPGGAEPEGGEPGDAESEGAESVKKLREWLIRRAHLRSGATRAGGTGAARAGGAGVTAGPGGTGGTAATSPGGARTRGTGAAGTCAGGAGARGTSAGGVGAGGAGARGIGAGGAGAGGAGAFNPGAGDARAGIAGGPSAGGTTRPRPYFVPLLQQSGGLTVRRESASCPASPVHNACRVPCSRPPPVPGTHAMALRPSSVPLRVPLPTPPTSSLPEVLDPESDRACVASPTISRLLATAVTNPSFQSTTATALVVEVLDFVDACRLDYANALVIECASASPTSVGGECALGTDVLEDNQRQGVDYFHTFSPTPKMTTLRVLLHVAAQRDYELHSLDFSTAFLQGSLHEEIWLRRPPGFTGSFPAGTQWSLRRPVYGLRQAPREWHDTLRTTLAALGFAPSTADPSLFPRTDTSLPPFYVLVFVDDLVFATADIEALALVKSELQKRHTYTDLGELHSYLGLLITRDRARRTITLTQSHMVHQVLQRFSFQFSSP